MPDPEPGARPAIVEPSPAARERAVELLTRNYAADQLSEAELQARLDRVYQATTLAELQALVADLPAEVEGAATSSRVTALFSGQEQRLTGTLPRILELRARFGYVELDLSQAAVQPGVTTIDVRAFAGYVQIRLPAGVRVESTGHAILGFFALKGRAQDETAHEPVIRIRGRALAGFAECYRTAGQARLASPAPPRLDDPIPPNLEAGDR